MGRRILQMTIAAMVTAFPLVASVAPARADNASVLLGLVNVLRAAHGAAPLSADPTLTRVAQAWSAHMASGAGLVHDPNVASQLSGGWTKLGENIGAGGNVTAIYNAFVNSEFHFTNMIDPTYNLTGIGVVLSPPSTLWVTEDFEAKPGVTPGTTQPPATTATTTALVVTVATVSGNHPATTAPPPTAPRPAVTTTTAATSASSTTPSATLVPGSGTSGTSDTSALPRAPAPTFPRKLAAAASLVPPKNPGGLPRWPYLTLTGLALASVAAGGYVMRKRLHRQ